MVVNQLADCYPHFIPDKAVTPTLRQQRSLQGLNIFLVYIHTYLCYLSENKTSYPSDSVQTYLGPSSNKRKRHKPRLGH